MMEGNLPDMEKGYAIWLEPESLHYHPGIVQVRAFRGRMMQRGGAAGVGGWTCYALGPDGVELDADVAPGDGDFHKVAFFARQEGLYSLVVENNAEAAGYIQRARISVPVGHHVHGRLNNPAPAGLDLFCEEFREYSPGESIALKVFYDSRPLCGAEIMAISHLYAGEGDPWRGVSGEDGEVAFTFSGKGHWMFACTYSGSVRESGGQHGKTVHTSTFVVAGVR